MWTWLCKLQNPSLVYLVLCDNVNIINWLSYLRHLCPPPALHFSHAKMAKMANGPLHSKWAWAQLWIQSNGVKNPKQSCGRPSVGLKAPLILPVTVPVLFLELSILLRVQPAWISCSLEAEEPPGRWTQAGAQEPWLWASWWVGLILVFWGGEEGGGKG